ncbi:MAG: undecaprenyl/decaprenyl-phosphate alpha-N-acetylglucosaminyl 1-phosphate transferase [Flavobacteriales bacterium]|nr:undecaprenyl/decaprenyl-phosphate alpha-N-acetylglucosaminyl 1-phosphate transferase [Flavobacteriales bacterium]
MYSPTQLFLIHSGLFFTCLVFSLLINSLFLRFARTLGIRDNEELIRWSATSKPAFGGIAFAIVFLGVFAMYGTLFPKHQDPLQPRLLGLLASTGLGFLMGLADDAYNTRPYLKLSVQLACGFILVLSGSVIQLTADPLMNTVLTVFWVVGLMNAINMLDNMDGITTIASMFILGCALVSQAVMGHVADLLTVLITGVLAALAGFLFFNWHPSRMFMGDTGSQFLGVFLAYVGIECFWNVTSPLGVAEPERRILLAILVFLLPIADTTSVTINRLLKGRSPFVGGRDHTTHHLSYAGLNDAQVALTFAGLGTLSLVLTFAATRFINVWENLHTVLYVSYAASVGLTLFIVTRRTRPNP